MTAKLSRRTFTATAAAAAIIAAGTRPALSQATTMRMVWWGAPERAKRTNAAIALFQKANPGVQINAESMGWADYWPRLATQTAGGNAPDVIQMDYRYQAEYGRRGTLLQLDQYVSKGLDLSAFDKPVVDGGRVDGKLYALSMGTNSTTLYYNMPALQKLGIKMPDHRWTWDDYAKVSAEITKASNKTMFGTSDNGGNEPPFEAFVRQRGRALYSEEGKITFTKADVADWLAFWEMMRKTGACVTPDIQASYNNVMEKSSLITGKAAMDMFHSNQVMALQALTPNELGMNMFPQGPAGAKPGQYLKPAMLLSAFARTRQPELAIKMIDFISNNPEAVRELSVERGIPGSAKMRAVVAPDLNREQKKMLDYIELVAQNVSPLPPSPPNGAGEVYNLLTRTNEAIGFGKMNVAQGTDQFWSEAQRIIG